MHKKSLRGEYDIIIVGAGPAGCSAAKFLSGKYNILMVDWSKFPRDKSCGGLLVEETQDFIKDWRMPKNVFSFPKYLNMKIIDWDNDLKVDIKRKIWNVSRRDFDCWLLKVLQNDIHFFPEAKFLEFEEKKKNVEILLEINNKRKHVRTKYLIGANGVFSNIRKVLAKKPMRYYIAIQHWIKHDNIGDSTYFIYDNEITNFYSWIIPKRDNLILGSALKKDSNIKDKMKILKKKLKEKLDISGKVFKKEAAILSRPKTEKDIFLGNDKVFLVGEAAGFISSSSGEGISFALRSGYNCARAINENSKDTFSLYEKFSENLINEIKEKINKSDILSVSKKRKAMFQQKRLK